MHVGYGGKHILLSELKLEDFDDNFLIIFLVLKEK